MHNGIVHWIDGKYQPDQNVRRREAGCNVRGATAGFSGYPP
jgi:hypothetical protein